MDINVLIRQSEALTHDLKQAQTIARNPGVSILNKSAIEAFIEHFYEEDTELLQYFSGIQSSEFELTGLNEPTGTDSQGKYHYHMNLKMGHNNVELHFYENREDDSWIQRLVSTNIKIDPNLETQFNKKIKEFIRDMSNCLGDELYALIHEPTDASILLEDQTVKEFINKKEVGAYLKANGIRDLAMYGLGAD
ncbi:hypothetical protein [Vibrio splendidus]|uniref:hypothetical protein n=1 Tax=Vibrio splendidus TaxID=29497 RepID=UPI003D1086A5